MIDRPSDKLNKDFSTSRPVLFLPSDVDIVVGDETGDLWIYHEKPVDLDLVKAVFHAETGELHFITALGKEFDMGFPLQEKFRSRVAQAQRVTFIYVPNETDGMQNMIFIPMTQISEK
ncbi:MAG: hypothetical protein H6868_04985 [Rhodospirillales bacterium]|nr:hypothetical protein [Rhodospirillales bacterium]